MIPPKTAGEFVEVLEQSQLIAPVHLDRIRANIPAPNRPGFDALTFAKAVVKEGMLTPYQARQLMAGRREGFFVGKYRLLEVLGQGGMGKVYLAEQTTMKRAVALKLVRIGHHDNATLKVRFAREARAAAKLRHPNITPAYDFDQVGQYHYIAMEFVEGLNLQEWVEKTGKMPWALAASYVSQAASALEHAWQNHLVHRDIKPGNLMVETTGILKLLDLGLAILPTEEDSVTLAQRDLILGTPDYVAPEQAMNSHDVDIRADIYSLGAVFFFLLSGHPPFPGKSAAAKIIAHQTVEPPSVQVLVPEIPKKLAEILHQMMAKRPEDRLATPTDVIKALKPFAQLATRAAPPYDLSLVRFTRDQVEKYLRFGADAPPAQTRPHTPFGATSMADFRLPAEMLTPKPIADSAAAAPTRSALPTAREATPRDGIPNKPFPRRTAATPRPPTLPRIPGQKPKARAAPLSTTSPAKMGTPPGEKKSSSYLVWIIFTVPNILALILLYVWLVWGR